MNLDPRVLGPYVLGASALVLLAVGGILFGLQASFGRRALHAEGTVVGALLKPRKQGPSTYQPVVEFHAGGRSWRIVGALEDRDWPRRQGEKLGVLYESARPEDGILDDPVARFTGPACWLLLGAALLAAGLVLRFRRPKAY